MELVPGSALLSLTGRTAVVTGGAQGIGKGISYRLAEAGASVVVADMNEETAQATVAEFTEKGWKAKAVTADVSNEASVATLIQTTVQAFGALDIFVNNAGIYPNQTLAAMTLADFEKVIDINLKGVFLCTKAASTQMVQQGKGGKIINVTSIDAIHPSMVGLAHYDASKHGVWGFTKNVARELAEHKIWVNAIAPGGIATPGATRKSPDATAVPEEQVKAMTEAFLTKIPMHRMGEADEIGKVALFLASDMSSYMTGEQVVVDGGVLLN